VALIFFILRQKPNRRNANILSPEYTGMPEAPGDQNFPAFKSELAQTEKPEGNIGSKQGIQPAMAELPGAGGHGYMRNSGQHLSELECK
jgi:hypothetical protein